MILISIIVGQWTEYCEQEVAYWQYEGDSGITTDFTRAEGDVSCPSCGESITTIVRDIAQIWIDEFVEQQIACWQNELAIALSDGEDPAMAQNMLEAWTKADMFGMPYNWPDEDKRPDTE